MRYVLSLLFGCCLLPGADPGFQPQAPYHAAFFYPWFPFVWRDQGHTPPRNWFSNYMPDFDPCQFDPATELYDSKDDAVIYWQLRKMAQARIEVAISSWWGQRKETDLAFRKIVTDVMNRPDNPYPNLRWAIYYEHESETDPGVAELVSDLNYIKAQYAGEAGYLKVDGRPVVFVYADGNDRSGMADRWAEARLQTGFYVVLKVYQGYAQDAAKVDSWHQYAPAVRYERQGAYSAFASPGFWKDGESVRLRREMVEFRDAVSTLGAANVTWKLIQTWNEWGEGTAVEPGEQVNQSRTGAAAREPDGVPFRNLYVEALGELLPPLEQGTGAGIRGPTITREGIVNAASMAAGAVAPGEIVTLFGAELSGARVLFDCAPAVVLFAQAGQVNAVVPEQAAGKSWAQVWVEAEAGVSDAVTVPASAAAPGLFAAAGKGQGAILNQDGSVNSASNPADHGSVTAIFATGGGMLETNQPDGLARLRLPVSVRIGGAEAEVFYAGAAPQSVPGLLQIDARVPEEAPAGDAVPVALKVGEWSAQAGVTIAVK